MMSLNVVEKVNNRVRLGPIGIGGGIGPWHLDEMEKILFCGLDRALVAGRV